MFLKKYFLLLFAGACIHGCGAYAQDQKKADSLIHFYQQDNRIDTAKLELLMNLSFNEIRDYKKGLKYAEELISLSKQARNKKYLFNGYFLKGTKERLLNNLEEALKAYYKSAGLASEMKNLTAEGESYGAIGDVFSIGNNHNQAINNYNKAIGLLRKSKNARSLGSYILNAGDEFFKTEKYDSALLYFEEAKIIFDTANYLSGKGYSLGNIGMVYASLGKNDFAEKNINEAILILEKAEDYHPICDYLISMADVYSSKDDVQRALTYAQKSLQLAKQYGLKEQIANANRKVSELYEKVGNAGEALKYYKNYFAYTDTINNNDLKRKMEDLNTDFLVSQKQKEVDLAIRQKQEEQKLTQEEKKLTAALGVILGLSVILLGIFINNNRNKQKAYKILNLQKQETEKQKAKAEDAFTELQATQKQLIQAAKMASLGELTAGIAHEIQNPLNFVNNFSEVSVELLDELKQTTADKLVATDKAQANDLIKDLTDNLKKIIVHGQRAASIVKGMLQHSRAATGKKELTDINNLAEEYLRLSYHGLRAKDKEFNAGFTSSFDEKLEKMEVVPQDIGRVLLNLYNNAFYSVNEKRKRKIPGYEPLVTIATRRVNNTAEISVKDNGIGISQEAIDKIFQPFFTTKPTGQGTGLGLSLSYDIIKAHGGELKVETKEGEFAEFIIQLPLGTTNS